MGFTAVLILRRRQLGIDGFSGAEFKILRMWICVPRVRQPSYEPEGLTLDDAAD